MDTSNSTNEAEIGHLLFGIDSPVSLKICLDQSSGDHPAANILAPFEVVTLGVGYRYYLAKLSLGNGFMEQFVLLNVFNANTDDGALKEQQFLQNYRDQEVPFPSYVNFNPSNESKHKEYAPVFYCVNKHTFFQVPCVNCGAQLQYDEEHSLMKCGRCSELSDTPQFYSFFDTEDSQTHVILLEDVFAEFSQSNNFQSSVPCSGCDNASHCFPDNTNGQHSVVNESHAIIPFSHQSFSLHGFSYHPLSLIDYCELVSGKRKSEQLQKYLRTSELGKYKVLQSYPNFEKKEASPDFITGQYPELHAIFSTKLRVFLRVCQALSNLDKSHIPELVEANDISMDMSQWYAAGDSHTRASVVFNLSMNQFQKNEGGLDQETENLFYCSMSNLLLLMFFKNENNNELAIDVEMDALVKFMNSDKTSSNNTIEESLIYYIQKQLGLFCLENLYFYDDVVLKSDLSDILVRILRLVLILSQRIQKDRFSDQMMIFTLDGLMSEIKHILYVLDQAKADHVTHESDEQLLRVALQEIINDSDWISTVLQPKAKHEVIDLSQASGEQTLIISASDAVNDKTILIKRSDIDMNESDETHVMTSINRILRQL